MSSSALKELTELHRTMYEKAYAEAIDMMGSGGSNITKYAQDFSKSLPDEYKFVNMRRISQAIDQSRIILYGDFHSHKQCQRALLRILRTYQATPDHAPMALALEMFRSKDQQSLNQWQEGRISDEELLDQTDYDRIWGFPWEHYRPLLDFCRQNSIPLYAANTKDAGKDSLKDRDDHAAKIIAELLHKHRSLRVFYIVGEYHLADPYLPKSLATLGHRSGILRIIANSDKYFFQMPQDKIHRRDVYLELNTQFFCVLNSPPWMKWQSQTLIEELRNIGNSTYIDAEIDDGRSTFEIDEFDSEDDDDYYYTEDHLDIDSHLRNTVKNIAQFLKIKNHQLLQDSFKILPGIDHEDIEHLPPSARNAVLHQSSRDGVAADFQRRLLFISEISMNNLAFASGLVIFGSLSNARENYNNSEELFYVQILKLTFGYLANKILNPRISLHTRKAIEDYIGATKGKHIGGQRKQRREVARACLKFIKWSESQNVSNSKITDIRTKPLSAEVVDLDIRTSHDVSRHIAQILASSIYRRTIAGKVDPVDLGKWFSKKCDNPIKVKQLIRELTSLI